MAPEEAIQMLMTVISGINREQSQTLLNVGFGTRRILPALLTFLLQRNNNDVNQAVNFYYEDPTTALKSIVSWLFLCNLSRLTFCVVYELDRATPVLHGQRWRISRYSGLDLS